MWLFFKDLKSVKPFQENQCVIELKTIIFFAEHFQKNLFREGDIYLTTVLHVKDMYWLMKLQECMKVTLAASM